MKLKIDENLPAECAEVLRRAGLEADTVADEGLTGVEDSTLAAKSRLEGRVLVTLDLDSANIRAYLRPATREFSFLGRIRRTKNASSPLRIASHWFWRTARRRASCDCGDGPHSIPAKIVLSRLDAEGVPLGQASVTARSSSDRGFWPAPAAGRFPAVFRTYDVSTSRKPTCRE